MNGIETVAESNYLADRISCMRIETVAESNYLADRISRMRIETVAESNYLADRISRMHVDEQGDGPIGSEVHTITPVPLVAVAQPIDVRGVLDPIDDNDVVAQPIYIAKVDHYGDRSDQHIHQQDDGAIWSEAVAIAAKDARDEADVPYAVAEMIDGHAIDHFSQGFYLSGNQDVKCSRGFFEFLGGIPDTNSFQARKRARF